jgi:signal transduction histidine kinase
VLEVAPVGLWVSRDPNCEKVEGNSEALRQLCIDDPDHASFLPLVRDGVPTFQVFIEGEPVAPPDLPMVQAARDGRTFRDVDHEIRFADGSRTRLRVRCIPLFDDAGRPAGMVASSIQLAASGTTGEHAAVSREPQRRTRDLRETYDRVRDFERLAITGTIAAGLGHDLGNLLLPLRLRLDALRRIQLPAEAESDIAAIESAVNHLQQLSTQLRWLASDSATGTDSSARTRLSTWIEKERKGFESLLPAGVQLTVDVPPNLPAVRVSTEALTRAMANLVQNSGQALRGRPDGVVHIGAEATADGRSVRISAIDNGPGMSAEAMERCFEPFYSTKQRQIATGLGLAIVRSLVRRAGGDVSVTSDKSGATFMLRVPAAERGGRGKAATDPRALVTVTGDRRRALVRTILSHEGYELVDPEDAPEVVTGVWVSDLESGGSLADLEAFVNASPRRWALVIGRPSATFDHPRLVNAGGFDDLPALRAALELVPHRTAWNDTGDTRDG